MSILLIIEAPGKIGALRKSAQIAFPGVSVQVMATGGQLVDLPMDELGVDPLHLTARNEKPLDNGISFDRKLDEILKKSGKEAPWSEIWVMSDPDREGEGIAAQIWNLLAKHNLDAIARRAFIQDLSPDSLREAVFAKSPHPGMTAARQARRVIDRVIPRAVGILSKIGDWRGLGRVQLAACTVIRRETKRWKPMLIVGSPWASHREFQVEARARTDEEAINIRDAFLKTNPATAERVERIEIIPPPAPHHAASLLSAMRGMAPEECAMAAQEAYMAGRMSYPRSDSVAVSHAIRQQISAHVARFHLSNYLRDNWWEGDDDSGGGAAGTIPGGAHPGIHPVSGSAEDPPAGYSPQALMVEEEVTARAMASLLRPAIVRVEEISVIGSDAKALAREVLEPGWLMAMTRMNRPRPFDEMDRTPITIRESLPTKTDVAVWLWEAGLGRPSTLAFIPERMMENGLLSSHCSVTNKGISWMETIARKFPAILDPETTREIESILSGIVKDPDNYQDAVTRALTMSGIDTLSLSWIDEEHQKLVNGVPLGTGARSQGS